jgi:hypothetical protein
MKRRNGDQSVNPPAPGRKLEHFPEKWMPVFRQKMRLLKKNQGAFRFNRIGKRSGGKAHRLPASRLPA